jgi:predicted AAA+ superfamily ATPase
MGRKVGDSEFERTQADVLAERLHEERRFIQVVSGPRQVGKTTLVRRVLARLDRPCHYVSADEPALRDATWLRTQWEQARLLSGEPGAEGAVLAIDEVQKIVGWSEVVKRLWDEDTASGCGLQVVILGSAPLLLQDGLVESLAGRFEQIRLSHWSFEEMHTAFGLSFEQYLFFGGYPGAAPLIGDEERWRRYLLDSLIETTISRDVLLMNRVDKPALFRRVFELGCRYSGQILSYNKMLGQLQDAGNTTTLAHYLDLLGGVGMVRGLPKYAGAVVRQRGSSPKLQVLNTALMTSQSGLGFEEVRRNPEYWGRLTESAVGAHLANHAMEEACEVFYWRDRNREVDFVIRSGQQVVAVEVKSGRTRDGRSGLAAFETQFEPTRVLLVGGDGIPVEEFLSLTSTGALFASR